MATVYAFPPRTPSIIMCDLTTAKARLASLDVRIGIGDPSDAEDAEWSRLEDRIGRLGDEAKAAIYDATGVPWDLWEGALA